MAWAEVLKSLGWEWILPKKEIQLSLSELNIIELSGDFDLGYSLSSHSCLRKSDKKRTKMGELVYRFKYKFDKQSGEKLADLVIEFLEKNQNFKNTDVLITVPPSFSSRPFDPLTFLAQRISQPTKIQYLSEIIKRKKISKPQKKIFILKEKWENISDAFIINNEVNLQNKKVLLLDDLYDSGATVNTISKLLKEIGVEKIFVLTIAKTSLKE
jgi:ComF family protein